LSRESGHIFDRAFPFVSCAYRSRFLCRRRASNVARGVFFITTCRLVADQCACEDQWPPPPRPQEKNFLSLSLSLSGSLLLSFFTPTRIFQKKKNLKKLCRMPRGALLAVLGIAAVICAAALAGAQSELPPCDDVYPLNNTFVCPCFKYRWFAQRKALNVGGVGCGPTAGHRLRVVRRRRATQPDYPNVYVCCRICIAPS